MRNRKNNLRIVARPHKPLASQSDSAPAIVSPRWLMTAISIALVGASICAWGTLCLLFWQGSWQLLYRPKASVERTPTSVGIPFDRIGIGAVETGQPRIQAWWIPAAPGVSGSDAALNRLTILYLHGASGNLGDSVDALARFHALGTNVLAFDYRGYGQSQFAHPSEAGWLDDAHNALDYLTQTRHLDPKSIVIAGKELGADLAVEVAAAHSDLGGVIVESPIEDPASVIFRDSRARLVPARLLVKDRYDLDSAAKQLQIPSLWLLPSSAAANAGEPSAFSRITTRRQLVRLVGGQDSAQQTEVIATWLKTLIRN
jgi:uncharacterized protein